MSPDAQPSDTGTLVDAGSKGTGTVTSIDAEKGGRFEFRGLPAGHYALTISRDRQTLRTSEFDVTAGQHYELPPP